MELKHINGYAIQRLKIKLSVFILAAGLFMTLFYYELSNSGSEEEFKKQAVTLKQKVQNTKQYLHKSSVFVDKWNQQIINKNPDRVGLKLEEFRALLDDLKNSYNLRDLQVNLQAPSNREDIGNLKYVSLRYTTVSITFNAFTDIEVYKFIAALQNELPGYVQIKEFNINAANTVDINVANTIATQGAQNIISARLNIVWHDIDDK